MRSFPEAIVLLRWYADQGATMRRLLSEWTVVNTYPA
jgi:hypothetical protein